MSDMRRLCREAYQDALKRIPMHPDLRRSLKGHERVPAFIDNLAREFSKLKFEVKRETIEAAVADFTRWFVLAIDRTAAERSMSEIQKLTIKAKQDEQALIQKLVDDAETIAEAKGADYVTQDDKGNEIHVTKAEIEI